MKPVVVVVLGAGASYDCSPTWSAGKWNSEWLNTNTTWRTVPRADARPPLVKDLLEDSLLNTRLLATYSRARPLVMQLRAKMARSDDDSPFALEDELAAYLDSAAANDDAVEHLAGFRSFLLERIRVASDAVTRYEDGVGGLTNHAHLFNALHSWAAQEDGHVLVISFNYDTVAEAAMADVWGFRPSRLEDFVNGPRMTLLKPHGSVDWVYAVRSDQHDAIRRIQRFEAMNPDDPVAVCHKDLVPDGLNASLPAIALPVRNKDSFVWPSEQAASFESFVGHDNVRGLLTIGWNAAEQHFMPSFSTLFQWEPPNIMIVAGREDWAKDAWRHRLKPHVRGDSYRGLKFGSGGFSDLCVTSELDDFVSRLAVA